MATITSKLDTQTAPSIFTRGATLVSAVLKSLREQTAKAPARPRSEFDERWRELAMMAMLTGGWERVLADRRRSL